MNEIKALLVENELAHKKIDEEKENIKVFKKNNAILRKELLTAESKLEDFYEQLKIYGGSFETIHKLSSQVDQLSNQVDYFKDDLKEAFEEKDKVSKELSTMSIERNQLIEQVQILRRELDNLVKLKEEVENLKHNLQVHIII